MEKVINRLYEIEKEAAAIVEGSSEKKKELYEGYQNELHNMDTAMEKASMEKLEKLRREMNAEIKQEHELLARSLDKKLGQMETDYHRNHDRLVEEMVKKIAGV